MWCAWWAWCAHPAATEEAALVALAEHTTMLTDAVGGLSTLMADWVLVREGQRVAAEGALLEQRLHPLASARPFASAFSCSCQLGASRQGV